MPKENMVSIYEHIEDAARDEVFLAGGCISHHHGVGKIRKGFIDRTLPKMAIDWQKTFWFANYNSFSCSSSRKISI